VRAKQADAAPAASPERSRVKSAEDNQLTREFAAWRKEYNQWLKTSGRNHGGLSELK